MPPVFPTPSRRRASVLAAVAMSSFATALAPGSAYAVDPPEWPQAGDVVIEEFRFHGPNGRHDEYIELYNKSTRTIELDPGDDQAEPQTYLQFWTGSTYRSIALAGTLAPAEHLLISNVGGSPSCSSTLAGAYSLNAYSCGDQQYNGKPVASAPSVNRDVPSDGSVNLYFWDGTYTDANNDGIADADEANTRTIDQVGFASVGADFFETTPLTPIGDQAGNQYAWVRKFSRGEPVDTNNNANDFVHVGGAGDTWSGSGVKQILGAPGPQACDDEARQRPVGVNVTLFDPTKSSGASPNWVYTPENNAATPEIGTGLMRRVLTNTSGASIDFLRLRMAALSTKNSSHYTGASFADMRLFTSTGSGIAQPTTLEDPPAQPLGGGLNSSATVPVGAGLANGASVAAELRFKVYSSGGFLVGLHPETLFLDPDGFGVNC